MSYLIIVFPKMNHEKQTPAELRHVKNFRIHRLSGAWILLIDNLFFVGTVSTGGLALPISCLLASITGGLGVFLIEKLINKNSYKQSLLRGLIAGILSGIPISIAGTVYGGWVLAMAGINQKENTEIQSIIEVQSSTSDSKNK